MAGGLDDHFDSEGYSAGENDVSIARTMRDSLGALRTPAVAAMVSIFLINVASYADRTILVVLQEPIKHDLELSDFQLGLLAGPAFAIFYAVMGIPIARIAERANRRRIVLIAVTLWSIFTALCGAAQSFIQLAFLRMCVGAAEAAAPPATHSLIADYFARKSRGRAMALLALGIPLGLMIGGLVGGLVTSAYSWRVAFFAIGVPGLLVAGLGAWLMYEPARTSDHGELDGTPLGFRDSLRSLMSIPMYRLLLVCAVLSGNASHAISTFSASYFLRAHELTLAAVGGILITGKGISGMFGTIVSGIASDKLDRGHGHDYLLVPAVSTAIATLLLWLSFDVGNTAVAMAMFIAAAFFANMIMSPAFAAVQNSVDPRTRATAAALFLFCITVPGSLGPVLVGLVSDMVGAASLGLTKAQYLADCPGGKQAAKAVINGSCAKASLVGLRSGMMVGIGFYTASVVTYLLAVRAGRRQPNYLERSGD